MWLCKAVKIRVCDCTWNIHSVLTAHYVLQHWNKIRLLSMYTQMNYFCQHSTVALVTLSQRCWIQSRSYVKHQFTTKVISSYIRENLNRYKTSHFKYSHFSSVISKLNVLKYSSLQLCSVLKIIFMSYQSLKSRPAKESNRLLGISNLIQSAKSFISYKQSFRGI